MALKYKLHSYPPTTLITPNNHTTLDINHLKMFQLAQVSLTLWVSSSISWSPEYVLSMSSRPTDNSLGQLELKQRDSVKVFPFHGIRLLFCSTSPPLPAPPQYNNKLTQVGIIPHSHCEGSLTVLIGMGDIGSVNQQLVTRVGMIASWSVDEGIISQLKWGIYRIMIICLTPLSCPYNVHVMYVCPAAQDKLDNLCMSARWGQ